MMEGNESLRDDFSTVITEMKEDGTMDRLVEEQIEAAVNGGEIKPIALPEIAGAETIKVAVTGALPPMDYVAADGNPAGFNTAVLAEIGRRLNKNIEIVVVDSVGRATALSSGAVDAVFWTRTNDLAHRISLMSEEEREDAAQVDFAGMTDEEIETIKQMMEFIDPAAHSMADMPEHTICTLPYYSDILVPVVLK